jgi:hypothetical protein
MSRALYAAALSIAISCSLARTGTEAGEARSTSYIFVNRHHVAETADWVGHELKLRCRGTKL